MAIVLEGPEYENFVDVIKSPETRKTYDYRMKQYLEHMKFASVKDLMEGGPAKIQQDIISYLKYMKKERALSHSSRQVVLAMFQRFYSQNDVVLNWLKLHGYLGERERTIEDRAYTREEIRKLLDVAPLRARVVILLLASTGLRRGAVPGIKRKHLIWNERYQLYQIVTYPKAKERYVTFCTPEAAKEINAYIAYREQCGEVIDGDSPLIREEFDVKDKIAVQHPKPASNNALKFILVRLVKLAGVKGEHQKNDNGKLSQRTELMLTHALRKFYDSNLVRAEINPIKVSALMGHRSGLQRSYLKLTDEELLEEYVKAVNNLTINDENRLKLQVKKLQVEKDELIEMLQGRLTALERANETREVMTENVERLKKPITIRERKK